MNVDCHFHIFLKNDVNKDHSRYPIDYDATIHDWIKAANEQQISSGILVQPSFLGFDNNYLLQAIKQKPKHLRGVGVVEPQTTRKYLLDLKNQGIRGARLNLIGEERPLDALKENQNLISHLKDLDMHLQLHHDDGMLNNLLLNIPKGISIVVDHFGRPATNDEFQKNNQGINNHLGKLWVKLSAQYRTPNIAHKPTFEYWLSTIGASRLLWGSDWPHTRFETSESYEFQMKKFSSLIDDYNLRDQILSKNPSDLYWP